MSSITVKDGTQIFYKDWGTGHPRLLMRGLSGAKAEIGLSMIAYNFKRIINVLGAVNATEALHRV